jgi:hypothetical protein
MSCDTGQLVKKFENVAIKIKNFRETFAMAALLALWQQTEIIQFGNYYLFFYIMA